jgi:hypothetical protein
MGLAKLPPELQLLTFYFLVHNYSALYALTRVSKNIRIHAFEVLGTTFDLWQGKTDDIDLKLCALLHRADAGDRVPRLRIMTTGSDFGDNIIKLASGFKTLRICFDTRHGRFTPGTQAVPRATIDFFRRAMQALTGKTPKNTVSWGKNFGLRKADASMQFIFQALRHVTTLHLGGSTNCLPWNITGTMEMLENLKFTGISNAKLSYNCVRLAHRPGLKKLEFSNMAIPPTLLEFLPKRPVDSLGGISATELYFINCWVPHKSLARIVQAFNGLQRFEYSLSMTVSGAPPYWSRNWHIGEYITALHQHRQTLAHLKIVRPEPSTDPDHLDCNHIGSLADFTAIESLSINARFIAPHTDFLQALAQHQMYCRPWFDTLRNVSANDAADPMTVLSTFPRSLNRLELSGCSPTVTTLLLPSIERGRAVGSLRELKIVYAQQPSSGTATRPLTQQELDLVGSFKQKGIKLKIHT